MLFGKGLQLRAADVAVRLLRGRGGERHKLHTVVYMSAMSCSREMFLLTIRLFRQKWYPCTLA
jgi:hypothetical protein